MKRWSFSRSIAGRKTPVWGIPSMRRAALVSSAVALVLFLSLFAGSFQQAALAANPPSALVFFNPNPTGPNSQTQLTIQITNTNGAPESNVQFTDTFPTSPGQMVVANTPGITITNCGGGTTNNPAPGSASFTFSGGTIAAGGNCQIQINVSAPTAGTYTNTLSSFNSSDGAPASTPSGSLTILSAPTASKTFNPTSMTVGGTSTVTITISNPNASDGISGLAFTDTLPTGSGGGQMVVATTPTLSNTCNGTATANPGANTISLSGGSIGGGGSCSVSALVTAPTAGSYSNSTGAITTTNAGNGAAASASLTVNPLSAVVTTKSFTPASITAGGTTVLTISIQNPNSTSSITGVSFSDSLPAGSAGGQMVVAATPGANTSNCGSPSFSPAASATTLLFSGGTIAASQTCVITVSVSAPTAGTYTNTTSTITTTNAGTGAAASTALTVIAASPTPVTPTATPIPPTATPITPTATSVGSTSVPSSTPVGTSAFGTNTPIPTSSSSGGEISASLDVDNDRPFVNQLITFTMIVRNTGTEVLNNVQPSLQVSGQLLVPTATGFSLGVNQSMAIQFPYTVLPTSSCTLTPQGSVTAVTASGNAVSDSTIFPPFIDVLKAELTIGLVSGLPSTAVVGQTVTANIPLINTGCLPVLLTSESVTNPTTSRLGGMARPDADTVTVNVNMVLPGQTAIATSSHTFVASDPALWRVQYAFAGTATVTLVFQTPALINVNVQTGVFIVQLQGGVNSTNGTAGPTNGSASNGAIQISKSTTNGTARPGSNVTFNVTVNNLSPALALTGVTVTDTLPTGFTYVSSTPTGGTATNVGNSITFTVISLAPSQSASVSIVAKVGATAGTVLNNTACVMYTGVASPLCTSPIAVTISNSAGTLPTTGFGGPAQTPDNKMPLLLLITAVIAVGIVGGVSLRRLRR